MKGLANIKPSRLVSSPPWFVAFLAAIAVCLLVLAANAMVTDVRPTTTWGQAYGIAAAALLVLAGLYGMRRRMIRFTRRVSLGRSRNWVHFHVYSGTVFLLLVFMHTGFRVPTGTLTTWLWWLSIWLTLSGMLGIALQRWIPRLLTSGLATEVHYDRIPELVGELKARAEELMTDADRHLRRFYAQSVAPALVGPSTNLLYYVDISGGLKSRTRQFDYLRRFVATDEKVRVDQLQNIYHTKLELDAHYTLQKALRWWSLLHIPVALIALVLMVAHVYAVLYY